MNHFERPDYDTEKFGRMFAERFFMDADFRDSGCIILENVCENYMQVKQKEAPDAGKEDRPAMEETDFFPEDEPDDLEYIPEDEPDDLEYILEEEAECFELVIIKENRVLAAVSVAQIPMQSSCAGPLAYQYRRRDSFNRMVREKFAGMEFTEIEKKSCGWNIKRNAAPSFEGALFGDEAPLKEELRWMEMDDYHQVRSAVLKGLAPEKAPEYRIPFRSFGADLAADEKALRSLAREGLIRREGERKNRLHITAAGRAFGMVSAYRRGKSGPEQVVMAVDDGRQDFDKIRRWELGKQSLQEEMEIFGVQDQKSR